MLYILSRGLRVSRLQLLTFNAADEINANYLGYFRAAATSNTADRSIQLLQSRVVFSKKKKKIFVVVPGGTWTESKSQRTSWGSMREITSF